MKKPTCDICGKVFSRRDNMERHRTRHLHREVYRCETCGRDFSQKSYLKLHRRLHTGERPFGCNVCGRAFSRNDHLVIHIRGHQGIKMFNCNVCNKSFARRSYLTVHQRIHSNTRPYRCHICGCAFYRGDHLVRHRVKQHGEVKAPTQRVNNISLVSNNATTTTLTPATGNIINHPQGTLYTEQHPASLQQVQTEQGQIQVVTVQTTSDVEEAEVQQAFKCSDGTCSVIQNPNRGYGESLVALVTNGNKTVFQPCEMIVHQNSTLPVVTTCSEDGQMQKHVYQATAAGTAKFVASIPAAAALPVMTKTSTSTTNSVDYKCDFCSKSFSRKDNLERHKLTHSNEKLFSCDICQKSFSRRSYLSVHRRIHTGEKPFVCDRCGFAFSRKDHLLKHKRANEGQLKLSCVPPKHSMILKADEDAEVGETVAVVVTTDAGAMTDGTMVVAHTESGEEVKTVAMYQAQVAEGAHIDGTITTAGAAQMYPVMSTFPTTIEISPSMAQIFPTIQMYPATTQMNVPLHANVSHEIIIPNSQIGHK